MKRRILVIEPDKEINKDICAMLKAEKYKVVSTEDVGNGKMLVSSHRPELIILDLEPIRMGGAPFLRKLRKESDLPVIALGSGTDKYDRLDAIENGADKYVVKPPEPEAFCNIVRELLAATAKKRSGKVEVKGLVIDYDSEAVFVNGENAALTETEYDIVAFLAEHIGETISYTDIVKAVWGYDDMGGVAKLQVNMKNIRKKLGAKPGGINYILNEAGVGYRLCDKIF